MRILAGVSAALFIAVHGCTSPTPDRQTQDSTPPAAINAVSMDSAMLGLAYPSSILGREVQLQDGEWSADSTAAEPEQVALVTSASGALTPEGPTVGAAVLRTDPAATGRFFDLVPVQRTSTAWRAGRATFLGDRVRPESLWFARGRIHLVLVAHDTADGLCCPTRRELRRYRLAGDSLVLEGAELLGRVVEDTSGH